MYLRKYYFFFALVHSVDLTGDFNIHKPFPILEYASKHLIADEPGVRHKIRHYYKQEKSLRDN